MSYHDNDDLKRAMEALTIFDLWERAHRDGAVLEAPPAQRRDGQYPSPFREDGRNGSFSVCGQGHGFKDFGGAGDKGGVWKFSQMCWPSLSRGDIAKLLIELSGISPTPPPAPARPRPPGEPAAPGEAAPAAFDPTVARAAAALVKRDKLRDAEDKVWRDREAALAPQLEAKPVPIWPKFIADRFEDGVRDLYGDARRMKEVAAERGWPVQWVEYLCMYDLFGYAWERWATPGSKWAKRQKTFRVDVPEVRIVRNPAGDGSVANIILHPVGYHQRWFIPAKGGQEAQKGWIYVPSVPKEAPRSRFEIQLVEFGQSHGVTAENRRGLIPPLPFVLGDLAGARLVVLLEGQWDAVTFLGACGGLHETSFIPGLAVIGIRGAQGVEPFLAYYAKWLRHNRPSVWIIADNDAAGAVWLKAKPGEEGMPDPPSFAERLEWLGCKNVVTSRLKIGDLGKDFNDYYRAAEPRPEDMMKWMKDLGLMTPKGVWA